MLAVPGVAGASAGQKSFAETYPVASRLCAKTEQGTEAQKLHASAPQILADCTSLKQRFEAARTAVLAAHRAILAARLADRAAANAACIGALLHKPSCTKARLTELNKLNHLNAQRILANRAYYRAAEGARIAFWTAIRALPGAKSISPDQPIHVAND
jgi:hypothetical protein